MATNMQLYSSTITYAYIVCISQIHMVSMNKYLIVRLLYVEDFRNIRRTNRRGMENPIELCAHSKVQYQCISEWNRTTTKDSFEP